MPRVAARFLLGFLAVSAAAQVRVQRHLADLALGDTLETVQRIYPPARAWSSYIEPGGEIARYAVDRPFAKRFPEEVSSMRLGLRRGRLVHLQLVYDEASSRKRSLSALAMDLSLVYGEPRRSGHAFWWGDDRTVLRAFNAEVKGPGGKSVELRTALELMDRDLFRAR